MVKTLRETKAKLSELVNLASRGEEVLISVRGQVKARLTRACAPGPAANRGVWVRELRDLQKAYSKRPARARVEAILAEQREERG